MSLSASNIPKVPPTYHTSQATLSVQQPISKRVPTPVPYTPTHAQTPNEKAAGQGTQSAGTQKVTAYARVPTQTTHNRNALGNSSATKVTGQPVNVNQPVQSVNQQVTQSRSALTYPVHYLNDLKPVQAPVVVGIPIAGPNVKFEGPISSNSFSYSATKTLPTPQPTSYKPGSSITSPNTRTVVQRSQANKPVQYAEESLAQYAQEGHKVQPQMIHAPIVVQNANAHGDKVTLRSGMMPAPVPPASMAVAPNIMAVAPTGMAVAPTSMAVAPNSTAVTPTSMAVAPNSMAVTPTSMAVAPNSMAVAPTSMAVAPNSMAVAPTSMAVAPTSMAVAPTSMSVAPTVPQEELMDATQDMYLVGPLLPNEPKPYRGTLNQDYGKWHRDCVPDGLAHFEPDEFCNHY